MNSGRRQPVTADPERGLDMPPKVQPVAHGIEDVTPRLAGAWPVNARLVFDDKYLIRTGAGLKLRQLSEKALEEAFLRFRLHGTLDHGGERHGLFEYQRVDGWDGSAPPRRRREERNLRDGGGPKIGPDR
jgi:hypothetical protein